MGMTSYPVACMSCSESISIHSCYRCGKSLCQSCTLQSYLPMCESCGWFLIDRSITITVRNEYPQFVSKLDKIKIYLKWSFSAFEIYGEGHTDIYLLSDCFKHIVLDSVSTPELEAKVGCIRWI